MAFANELEPVADRMWEAILEHPMVVQPGEGTLDEAPFRYWVRQDYRLWDAAWRQEEWSI